MDAPAPLPHALPSTLLAAPTRAGAPLVTSAVLELANPPQKQVARVCYHLLAVEMIRSIEASTSYRVRRSNDTVAQLAQADGAAHVPPPLTSEDEQEMVRARVEAIGMHLGAGIAARLSRNKLRFNDTLDVIKFLCKDVWNALWDKQIDNLRTNHKGVFVLQDKAFRPLCADKDLGSYGALQGAFAAGAVRGALDTLGVRATTTADVTSPPLCVLHVRIAPAP
ncbi:hypothetical protein MCUN1_002823 [Malassezia cuniculi]|uniref:Trafficking protein particle complex subunit 6B n=1 Tax=Malassezia cuniculi TaxID=948313 RepID=A0AAF0J6V1_9BASI|nr:hypothetical protein MCUN1_002823 [Malassezia cuniculi]